MCISETQLNLVAPPYGVALKYSWGRKGNGTSEPNWVLLQGWPVNQEHPPGA